MGITVRIPTPLRPLAENRETVEANGTTVAEVIEDLQERFPGLKERICDEDGEVRRFVNLYLNQEDTQLERLNSLDPEELLKWAYTQHGDRSGIMTSFQKTGCIMIDMAQRIAPGLRVITVDTLRLHQETYDFINTIEARYGIEVERFKPDPERLEEMIKRHGEHLFFESPSKQEHCCHIRKVEPNQRALATLDVWITGLRRDQSVYRMHTQRATMINQDGHKVFKLCPLADWTEEQVRTYINEHKVPCNPLYESGYTSISCAICTTPTRPGEDARAGRWRWFNSLKDEHNKECGMHIAGSGI